MGCQMRDGTPPPPPAFPDLQNLKDLEDVATGSAHSNGVMEFAETVKEVERIASDAEIYRNRVAETHVLVKTFKFW